MAQSPFAIKPLKQLTPNDCSITCLQMILGFYGKEVSRDEIYNWIVKATPEGGSFVTEIARFAKSKGFGVDCYAYNLYLTDPTDINLSKRKLVEKLDQELATSKRDRYYDLMLSSTIQAINEGVNYIIQKPTPNLLHSYLSKGIPVIASVNYTALHDKQGDPFESHDVVVTALKGNTAHFIDPEHAKHETIPLSQLLFAILERKIIAASAYLLAIRQRGD